MENVQYDKHIYFNYALTLFIFIATFNVFGMIPYSLTVTSYISITLALSGMSFFANLLLTFSGHGGQFVKFFYQKELMGLY
jgi:F0F1-type ATP synthase membrane subunit a